jgi:hypothetical protein
MKVTLPYDPSWQALAWAKNNCPSYVTNDADTTRLKPVAGGWVRADHRINYYFGNKQDAVIFALRWS